MGAEDALRGTQCLSLQVLQHVLIKHSAALEVEQEQVLRPFLCCVCLGSHEILNCEQEIWVEGGMVKIHPVFSRHWKFLIALHLVWQQLIQAWCKEENKHTHPKMRNKRRNSALPPSQPHHTPQKKKGEGEFLTLVASSVFKKESVQFKLDAAYWAKATSVSWIWFWCVLVFGPVCLHHSFSIRLWLSLRPHKGKPKPDILFYTENQGRLML